MRWRTGRVLLLGSVVLYLALVLALPLSDLVARLAGAGWEPIRATLADQEVQHTLRITAALALIAVAVNSVFGVLAAILLVRGRFPGRKLLDALVDLPFAASPVMTGLAFLLIFGRGGWFDPVLQRFDLKIAFAFPGLVIATLFVTLPFTMREVGYVLRELGSKEEEVAMTLGASPAQTFLRVTLPNVRYAVGYGVALTLARALGEFGAVLVLGGAVSGRTQTATTFIYDALEERREDAAYTMAAVLASISVALLLVIEFTKSRRRRLET